MRMMSSVGAADLPADVLNHIQSLLPIEDYVRFPAVCASWRSAAERNPNLHSDGMPWLLNYDFSDSYLLAFRPSPANDRPIAACKIPTPESLPLSIFEVSVLSSIGPRLVLCDWASNKLLLLNPFSNSSQALYLPADVISDRPISFSLFWKLVAPANYDGRNGIALALLKPRRASPMAYTAYGGPWIDLSDEYEYKDDDEDDGHGVVSPLHGQRFIDAVHYKGALFFALREHDEAVIALDFSSLSSPSSSSYPAIVDMTLNLIDDYLSVARTYPGSYRDARLVISPPYLYLVRWRLMNLYGCHPTAKVYVYRLPLPGEDDDGHDDNRRQCWVQVNELGGCSFFCGTNDSISVSARDCLGLRPDRICFPLQDEQFDRCNVCVSDYDDEEDIEGLTRELVHKLIYNLADGSWEEYCGWGDHDSISAFRSWSSRWMMPHLVPRSASSSELLKSD